MHEAFILKARDMKTMLSKVDTLFRKREKSLFATEGGSGGKKWARLAPSTIAVKKRLRGRRRRAQARISVGADVTGQAGIVSGPVSMKVMQRYGKLRKGLTDKGHGDHISRYILGTNARIQVGVRNSVAAKHGAGGRYSPKKIRNTMQMTTKQRRKYWRIVSDYLTDIKLQRKLRAMRAHKQGMIALAKLRASGGS